MFAHGYLAALVQIIKCDFRFATAIQHHLLSRLWQTLIRLFQVKAVMFSQTCKQLVIKLIAPVPAFDCARAERELRKSDDTFWIKKTDVAQPITLGACAHRVIE